MGLKVVFIYFSSHFLILISFQRYSSLNDCDTSTQRCYVGRNTLRKLGHHVAMCCDLLGVAGSSLTIFKLEPKASRRPQQGGQTRATCYAQHCFCVVFKYIAIADRDIFQPGFNTF